MVSDEAGRSATAAAPGAAWSAFLDELDAGVLDGPRAAERLAPDPEAPPEQVAQALLFRAIAFAVRGERGAARADAQAAIGHAPGSPGIGLLAARLRFALRDYPEAMAGLDAAIDATSAIAATLPALDVKTDFAGRLGAYRAAAAAADRALAIEPTPERHDRASDLLFSAQNPDAAMRHLLAAIALDPGSTLLRMKAAERLARLGRDRETLVEIQAAMRLSPGVPLLLFQASRLLATVGIVDIAESYLRAALRPIERVNQVQPPTVGDVDLRRALAEALQPAEEPTAWVVGPGQEEIVRRIVHPPSLPPGWEFVSCRVTHLLCAFYRNGREGVSARLILAHADGPGAGGGGRTQRTERFTLSLQATRQGPSVAALRVALEENVRASEAPFVWKRAEREVPAPESPPAVGTAETEAPPTVVTLSSAEAAPVHAALGRLRLWAGDLDEGMRCAEAALEGDPRCAEAHRLRGAVRLLRGEPAAAIPDLDRALALEPGDTEAYVWRAEARYRLGEYVEALADIVRGGELAEDFSDYVAAQLVKLLVLAALGRFPGFPDYCLREALAELCPGAVEHLDDGDPAEVRAVLERALERLRGNRSTTPTFVLPGDAGGGQGVPRPLRVRPSPRAPSKAALFLMPTAGVDEALAGFERVHADYPRSPEPYCYHGELHLYLGQYPTARRLFERALELYRGTRWAYIGLGATHVLDGDPREALAILRRGVELSGGPGPTTFVYRGEAHRRLGELAAAREDLAYATRTQPHRVGAWANLGLVERAEGHRAAAAAVVERLKTQAPALVSEAARARGVPVWEEPAVALGLDGLGALLEQVLALLRGNRGSACVTWFTLDGELRVVPPGPMLSDDFCRAELARLRADLERAVALRER
jgi:tetratricopeptide (TPR) repeat protein